MSTSTSTPTLRPAVETRAFDSRGRGCDTCGLVTSVKHFVDRSTRSWEVRVNFDGGSDRLFLYASDPGFYNGDRVHFEAGRLARLPASRTSTF